MDLGSVKGLYVQDPFNLSLDVLEVFYGVKPGRLTDEEIVRCQAYDDTARERIAEEGTGVREALGWQDTENPDIKAAWFEFAKAFGPARVRQVAKHMLNGRWDFDIDQDEDEPAEILMDRGMPIPTLPEEIRLYTVKNGNTELLTDRIAINRDNLIVAPTDLEGSHWMTDFKQAVQDGMGTIINDPEKVAQIDKADWLIAVGVNETQDSRNVFEEILRRNNALGEAAILAQDSPTNNTESANTQYTGLETDAEEYLAKTRMKVPEARIPADTADQLKQNTLDSHRVADLFKLTRSTLSELPGANLKEMTEAVAMAALLWSPCTLLFERISGMHFKQHFTDWSRGTKTFDLGTFFIRNVLARGILPIMRIEENPYGILPVVSLRNWHADGPRDVRPQGHAQGIYYTIINSLKDIFLKLAKVAPKIDLANSPDDKIYEKLLEILRSSPVSKRIDVRFFDSEKPFEMGQDRKFLFCPLVKDKTAGKEPCVDAPYPETDYLCELSHINRSEFDPSGFQVDANSPLLKRIIKYFLWLVFGDADGAAKLRIKGHVTDAVSGKVLPGATIRLGGTDLTAETDEKGDFVIADVPAGVHELEARSHNYHIMKVTNAAVGPYLKNKVNFALTPAGHSEAGPIAEPQTKTESLPKITGSIKGKIAARKSGRSIEGALVHIAGTGKSTVTDAHGEFSLEGIPEGNYHVVASSGGHDTATFSVSLGHDTPTLEAKAELAPLDTDVKTSDSESYPDIEIPGGLDLVADAAALLKRVHPDKLEILLVETLDLFSHRLDAWLTGLANARLEECQLEKTNSPPTGVYGWLEKPGELDFTPPAPEFIQAPSVKQATTAAILRSASINNGTDDNSGAFQINLSSEQIRKGLWYLEGIRRGHLPGELLGYRLERMIHEESRKAPEINETDIFDLRDRYPLLLHEAASETGEAASVLTIIDGEKFLDFETEDKFESIKRRLNQIKDAAADIALSEVIHADDNIARRGGWLDFLDGDGLPPGEEFIRSHRTGVVHATKVLLPIVPPENLEADESVTNPRIIADPILAYFCETLMPDFGEKEVVANLTKIDSPQTRPITFKVHELTMDPIDFVIGGFEEIKLRIRYHLLSCWKEHCKIETPSASPYTILGDFPDFETADELLNEVGIEIIPPQSANDTLNLFTHIKKAERIRECIHQNRSKNSLGTVPPEDLPILTNDQLEKLDPLAGLQLLSKRLRRIRDQLIRLILKTIKESNELKRRHFVWQGLQECRRRLRLMKGTAESNGAETNMEEMIVQLIAKINNLRDSDAEFEDLAENEKILDQIEQINSIENKLEYLEKLQKRYLGLEKKFAAHIEKASETFVANLRPFLLEISRFGLEKALTVFPDKPTAQASFKIVKLCEQLIAALIEKLNSLISDSSELQNPIHCLKVVYLHTGEINEVLTLNKDDRNVALEKLRARLPLTEKQANILLDKTFQTANTFESLINALCDEINNLIQNPTPFEYYLESAKIILIDDPEGIYNLVKKADPDVLEIIKNTYQITDRQAEIIIGFKLEEIDEFNEVRIRESIASATDTKITEVISRLQAATDKEAMVILTPYLLAKAEDDRPEWKIDFSQLTGLNGPAYLQEYRKVRPAISNLYQLFNIGTERKVYEDKRYQRLDPLERSITKEGNTDYLYLIEDSNALLKVKYLAFLLVDQWQEGIPNPDQSEITGVALKYESPKAEAPNAIILAVPPHKRNDEYWNTDLLADTILETIELMQIRMVSSEQVRNQFINNLPALLFPPGKDGLPLFPSRERLLSEFDLGDAPADVMASQLTADELSKTKTPFIRNEAPKIGVQNEY
jgi:hypothetical protein